MLSSDKILEVAITTVEIEINAIKGLLTQLNTAFSDAVQHIHRSGGRVIISGIGKSAIIAQKIVATLNSTGTASIFMHAADAIHGDLGMIRENDTIILISKSGETEEIKVLIPLIKGFGNTIIAICGNANSFLAQQCNYYLGSEVDTEACPNNLAPTSSTTAQLVVGDALAVCLLEMNQFSPHDFAKFHPGGALGKQLYLRVNDLVITHEIPKVNSYTTIPDIILEITSKRLGATAVIDEKSVLGIITDGDLRRMLQNETNFVTLTASAIMCTTPKVIQANAMAVDALQLMRENNISQLIVLDEDLAYKGIIHIHDLIKQGIV